MQALEGISSLSRGLERLKKKLNDNTDMKDHEAIS